MNKTVLLVLVGVVILAAVGGFFLLRPGSSTPSAPSVEAKNTVKEFTVDGTSFAFSPSKISVNRGDTVKITFKDQDGIHNLVVDGYNVSTSTTALSAATDYKA